VQEGSNGMSHAHFHKNSSLVSKTYQDKETREYLIALIFFFFQALNFLVESFGRLNDFFPLSFDPGSRLSSF
jgi:hypothetical protein